MLKSNIHKDVIFKARCPLPHYLSHKQNVNVQSGPLFNGMDRMPRIRGSRYKSCSLL